MVDAASGGVFVDKTPVQARNLIESMAANSQQFGTNRRNGQNIKVCGIFTARGHATDICPTLQEGSAEQVNAAGGFPGPPQRKYDPYSNTYNPGWKDHPNLRYGNPQATQAPPHNQAYRPPYPQQQQHPQETRTSIQQLNTQMGQLATAVNRLEALNSNSLPSQAVVNPRENVSAITLRGGKDLKVNEKVVKEPVQNKDEQESKVEEDDTIQEAPRGKFPPFSEYKPVAPFSLALKESRKDDGIKGLYEVFVFRRYEVNIHLLDAIKQVPHYAKFLKELCTVKRKQKLKGCKRVEFGEQVSAIIQRKVPTKCKDPGRPFLKTSKSVIDVNNGTLTMEFDMEIVKFHIFDTQQIPDCESVVNNLDVMNHLSQEHKKFFNEDKVKEIVVRPAENSNAKNFPSDLQASKVEPKLPSDRSKVISQKSKQRKQRTDITEKLRKWVKVVKKTRFEPP
ncbi:uncharacterized protein [Henckelia pumila]|uniref:uncharacterized protein n=1 Tax=Henckelia pumila TaxID=405737 RepID=UPI003C6E4286